MKIVHIRTRGPAPASASHRERFRRAAAAILTAALALTGLAAGTTAASATTPNVYVQTSQVQAGSYQTFFVEGFDSSGTLDVYLIDQRDPNNPSVVGSTSFALGTGGTTVNKFPRILVPTGSPVGNYAVYVEDGSSNNDEVPIQVVATAGATLNYVVDPSYTSVTIKGEGWVRDTPHPTDNALKSSVIGVKHEPATGPTIQHAYNPPSVDDLPIPTQSRATSGSSWQYLAAYVGPWNISGNDYSFAFTDPAAGDFEVTIPLPSNLASGQHTFRFLSGSLANTTANQGSTYPDEQRSKTVTFTKP